MSRQVAVFVDDRKVRAMLAQYEPREMHNRLRRGTRAGGAVYRTALRSYARSRGDVPDFFSKTRTRSSASMRSGIYTRVRPRSPLLNIFEGGADSHEIAPGQRTSGPTSAGRRRSLTGKMLLSGKAGQRWRSRDFVASMPVRHPGMAARPILAPVFEAATGAARRATALAVFGDRGIGLLGTDVG